ncbi:hypothetical protein ACLMAL_01155 [Nocardia sp. CWNU-33]|uniref:hypothetical protein n=1 Tax=Nocardia sp. CWNU-33 TaxID=3392117 RepID=UPI00398ED333
MQKGAGPFACKPYAPTMFHRFTTIRTCTSAYSGPSLRLDCAAGPIASLIVIQDNQREHYSDAATETLGDTEWLQRLSDERLHLERNIRSASATCIIKQRNVFGCIQYRNL